MFEDVQSATDNRFKVHQSTMDAKRAEMSIKFADQETLIAAQDAEIERLQV
jgi:hypothetical protein